mmetsp:Transcript_51919/g.163016  ORF Transcript_51919/g.163016 Transcript_51919/m.163016 type:complete len:419 (+) Transcript_51919:104-1360(+)
MLPTVPGEPGPTDRPPTFSKQTVPPVSGGDALRCRADGDGAGGYCSGGTTSFPDSTGESWAEDGSGGGSAGRSGSGRLDGKRAEDAASQEDGSSSSDGADDGLGGAPSPEGSGPADDPAYDDLQSGRLPSLRKDGPSVSRGGQGHPDDCKPCAFYCFSLRGCRNGGSCPYCHLFHESRLRQRREEWKCTQREKRRRQREKKDVARTDAPVSAQQAPFPEPPPGLAPIEPLPPPSAQTGQTTAEQALPIQRGAGAAACAATAAPQGWPEPTVPGEGLQWNLVQRAARSAAEAEQVSKGEEMEFFSYTPASLVVSAGDVVEFWPPAKLALMGLIFAISPELPAGLAIDEHVGVIYGKAREGMDSSMTFFVAACKPSDPAFNVKIAMVSLRVASPSPTYLPAELSAMFNTELTNAAAGFYM